MLRGKDYFNSMTFISKIANISAYIFILLTFVLTIVCIVSIWTGVDDVIAKTLMSMLLITFALIVILGIDNSGYFKKAVQQDAVQAYVLSVENFVSIRKMSFVVVIVSVTVSVALGLFSIWDILEGNILYKTLSTIMSIGFYALVTIAVCKQREGAMKSINVETVTPNLDSTMNSQTTKAVSQPDPYRPTGTF